MIRLLPVVLGVVAAAVCVRLGVWQLDRLAQRQARNALVEQAAALAPVELPASPSPLTGTAQDTLLAYRRVVARGRWDFSGDTVEAPRPRRGAPGVFLLTPLQLADGGAVLVQRGWAYAADGRSVDHAALTEPETTTVRGLLLPPSPDPGGVDPARLGARLRLARVVLRRTEPPDSLPAGIVVLDAPQRDEGPHRGYAIQWFAFAVIALVGGTLLTVRAQRTG